MVFGTEAFILFFIVFVFRYLWSRNNKPKNFPPGPIGLPILGYLPFLGFEPHKTVSKLSKKYGPILGIQFGSFRCVFINDYKLIKEAMAEPAFSGRPKLPFVLDRSEGRPEGIIFTEGRHWVEQRRFTLRHLRDFGFGSKSMEAIVQDEVVELIQRFKEGSSAPISTTNKFNAAVVNALWTIITGTRFKHDDPEFNKIIKMITESFSENVTLLITLATFIPWLAKHAPKITGYEKSLEIVQPTINFLAPYIDEHLKNHILDHPRDFLDSYIDEMKKTTDPTSSFHIDRRASLNFTIVDLFIAGAETTSTTLTWIFLYMARNQHVQEKLAEEIQCVVGNSRLPSLSDRPSMPYTEAVIHEVMRTRTLVPLSVMHSTTQDVHFHGFDIPKDTMVMINLYEAHNSIELWGDPENFRPERFLSKDGKAFERRDGFLAFSTGKRVCLGETLARDELFLFTASLFQVFHVGLDPSAPPPSLEGKIGGVVMPQPHKLVLTTIH